MHLPDSLTVSCAQARRQKVTLAMRGTPALLAAGFSRPRHYGANPFAFRAHSHFLYLTGASIEGAYLLLEQGRTRLFIPRPPENDDLWHGPSPGPEVLGEHLGVEIHWLEALPEALSLRARVAALPTADMAGNQALSALLGRPVRYGVLEGIDAELADALIQARLLADEAALAQLREAARITTRAFTAGMGATKRGDREWSVRAAMEHALISSGVTYAYSPIVSTRGEVLHNHAHDAVMQDGDLLLVDFGAESTGYWACDVTRTWPVAPTFSSTQRQMYDLVLAAEQAAIDMIKPGVRYRDVHLEAARVLTQGLVSLDILRGDVDQLVADGVHALLFPHGVGHLMGLDVHDMEDLGDRAGYAPGRQRSEQFGLAYLRMDRDLVPGMVFTIEPGFYQVPGILHNEALCAVAGDRLNREELARFSDVRGIRIEDDVLVTAEGCEVLTADIPKAAQDIEALRLSEAPAEAP